jgi:hypothetical protein
MATPLPDGAADADTSSSSNDGAHAAAAAAAVPPLLLTIETDIGHDCDDTEALLVALKDHAAGRVQILYISTVSQNNLSRAYLVQTLCKAFGIVNVPIVPSNRCVAAKDGRPLDRCTNPAYYDQHVVQGRATYVPNIWDAQIPWAEGDVPAADQRRLSPIVCVADSVAFKTDILMRAEGKVRVLVIGPGAEAEVYANAAAKLECVVCQGAYEDAGSFNVGCDMEAAVCLHALAAQVPFFFVDKTVAYVTKIPMARFWTCCDLGRVAKFDLRKFVQLGVMEFRDAARNLFNCINYGTTSPGAAPATKAAVAYDAGNPAHAALRETLTAPSTELRWFNEMPTLPPCYDLTAYLLLRDLDVAARASPWYTLRATLMSTDSFYYTATGGNTCIRKPAAEYVEAVAEELDAAMERIMHVD